MTRSLGAPVEAVIASATGEKVRLIELNFASAITRLTTAGQDILWNGQTWEAVGGHLGSEGLREVANSDAPGRRIHLSGVDTSIISLILSNSYRGRKAIIYDAYLDPALGTVIGTPVVAFDGYMNEGFSIVETRGEFGGGTVEIETRLTDKISDLTQVRGVRTNVHSHQREMPGAAGDTFFQHVAGLSGRKVYWGTKAPVDWLQRWVSGGSKDPTPYRPRTPIPDPPSGPRVINPGGGDPGRRS